MSLFTLLLPLLLLLAAYLSTGARGGSSDSLTFYPTPTNNIDYLLQETQSCYQSDRCTNPPPVLRRLISAVAAEYADMLLPEIAIATFLELYKYADASPKLVSWLSHAISSLHFGNGDLKEVIRYFNSYYVIYIVLW